MSFPAGSSVNDGISCGELPALRYISITDVALLLRKHHEAGGRPMFMAKVDLEAVYRQFPRSVRPIGGNLGTLSMTGFISTLVCPLAYPQLPPILVVSQERFAGVCTRLAMAALATLMTS